MKNTASFPRRKPPLPRAARTGNQAGSTLLASMSVVFVLAMIAATVLFNISSRYNSAYRSASFNEAMLTAEGGIDAALAGIFGLVPNVTMSSVQGLGTGYTQDPTKLISNVSFDVNGLIQSGSLLKVTPVQLTHAGEGGTVQRADVTIELKPLSTVLNGGVPGLLSSVTSLLNGAELQLLCITSTGTVELTGGTSAGPSRLDNDLWRPSIFTDRISHAAITKPTISRKVQVLLRPVYAFESAVVSGDTFTANDSGSVFDSFNSTQTTASTAGLYDSLKHLNHGTVRANTATVAILGKVYGDIDTNGSSVAQDSHVTGAVNNSSYIPLPTVNAPTSPNFIPSIFAPSAVTGNTTLNSGLASAPAQYRFTSISGNLHITKGLLGALATNVEIYVTGDITGGIEIDPGITAKIYVGGNINTKASQLKNDSKLAANFQIYGVPGTTSNPQIQINADANLVASIYAPTHNVIISGSNDFSGAVTANRFQINGAMRFHFDESLAAAIGPILRYQIASWQEITI